MSMKINNFKIKGQSELMEQFILVIIIVVLLVILVFYLYEWKSSDVEQQKITEKSRSLNLAIKNVLSNSLFVRRSRVFDSAKLTSLNEVYSCRDLRDLLGVNFIMSIQLENDTSMIDTGEYHNISYDKRVLCTKDNYPLCNRWEFCNITEEAEKIREGDIQLLSIKIPVIVNYFSDIPSEDKNHLATLYFAVMSFNKAG